MNKTHDGLIDSAVHSLALSDSLALDVLGNGIAFNQAVSLVYSEVVKKLPSATFNDVSAHFYSFVDTTRQMILEGSYQYPNFN